MYWRTLDKTTKNDFAVKKICGKSLFFFEKAYKVSFETKKYNEIIEKIFILGFLIKMLWKIKGI